MASDQWHCDIHRKLTHEKLITDKTKVPLSLLSKLGLSESDISANSRLRTRRDDPENNLRCLSQHY